MKEFLTLLVKALVDKPEMVSVEENEENGQIILKLNVAKEEMGKVIGKGGKIIKALRDLVKVKALKEGKKVYLQLVESQ